MSSNFIEANFGNKIRMISEKLQKEIQFQFWSYYYTALIHYQRG